MADQKTQPTDADPAAFIAAAPTREQRPRRRRRLRPLTTHHRLVAAVLGLAISAGSAVATGELESDAGLVLGVLAAIMLLCALAAVLLATLGVALVRRRLIARGTVASVAALAMLASAYIPLGWSDGCNSYSGLIPLWAAPIATPLETHAVTPGFAWGTQMECF